MKLVYSLFTLLALATGAQAQDITIEKNSDISSDTNKVKKYISIGSDGITVSTTEKKKEDKDFKFHYAIVDLGINNISDKTNYADPAVQDFLNVGTEFQNENLFSLREGKSINVNIYPVMGAYRMVNAKKQKVFISAGVGLQMYNFRFNKPITYINDTEPMVVMDTISFTKNKVGLTYLSIPLNLTFKTRLAKETWLVYGAGITGGYRIASWTKQVSNERGKQKNHDQFNFNNFNSCVTAEFGVEGIFRLYASYQLTALHENILDQHPYAIGIRFGGA
ncbi:MAG: hypothetical protein EOP50_05435 [Sphingobacteriales bacterium]|nr:MAG: hypothetical protein EOP50_05435 [Sphingobacteriales bacterium]